MRKILIPYFLGGLGHLSLARAIAYFLRRLRPDWEVRLTDPAAELRAPSLDAVYTELWKSFLRWPAFFTRFLFTFDRTCPLVSLAVNDYNLRPAVPKAAGFLSGFRPDLIFCTHWGANHLFDRARRLLGLPVPIWYVFGELGGRYQVVDSGADLYFSLSEEGRRALLSLQIPPEKIRPINLIVNPSLCEEVPAKEEARRLLGIPDKVFTIVLSLGGEGIGLSMELLHAFLREPLPMQMVILTGKNRALQAALRQELPAGNGRVFTFGYREDMDAVLAASDLLAGKPGCSLTMEAVMLGIPFTALKLGAPNERFNLDYLLRHGYGWHTPTAEGFLKLLREISSRPRAYEEVRERLSRVPRTNGAEQIAEQITAYLS